MADLVRCGKESSLSDKRFRSYKPLKIKSLAGVAHLHIVVRNRNCKMTVGIARVDSWKAKLGILELGVAVQELSAIREFQRERFDVSLRWS